MAEYGCHTVLATVLELVRRADGRELWASKHIDSKNDKFMDMKPDYLAIVIVFAGKRNGDVCPTLNCM